jgi:hypothetical protein
MADNIPEGLDDLLNSIRGEGKGKSQKSSAIVLAPKAEKKEQDNIENEDIDPAILRLLGLDDVFDIDYDTYKTLLREKMAAGRMAGSKMPTEEIELLTNEFKRVKGKTGRFKVKGQKIKSQSFVGKKKTSTSAIVKAAPRLKGKAAPDLKVESKSAEAIDEIGGKIAQLDKSVKGILDSSVKKNKVEEKRETRERVAGQRSAQREKEAARERSKLFGNVPDALKNAFKPFANIFDTVGGFLKKFLFSTLIMELLRFLENPVEYFRPLVNWVNDVIKEVNSGIKKTIDGIFAPINGVIDGANAQLTSIENTLNPLLSKMGQQPLSLPKVPKVDTNKISSSLQIPGIPYPGSPDQGQTPGATTSVTSAKGDEKLAAFVASMEASSPENAADALQVMLNRTASGYSKRGLAGVISGREQFSPLSAAIYGTSRDPVAARKYGPIAAKLPGKTPQEKFQYLQQIASQPNGLQELQKIFGGGSASVAAQILNDPKYLEMSRKNIKGALNFGARSIAQPGDVQVRPGGNYFYNFTGKAGELSKPGPGAAGGPSMSLTGRGEIDNPVSLSNVFSKTTPPPPPAPKAIGGPSMIPLPIGGQSNGSNVSTSTPNQKQVPNFSASNPKNPYKYAIMGMYNIVG